MKNMVKDIHNINIPEQFTVKAQPALFKGRGRGRIQKIRHYNIFQSTIDIHIQNQTLKSNISKTVRDREEVSIEVK